MSAKTFGELILEYQNYEYSKENYELTKECYELQLMSKYLESQEFLMNNIDDIKEEYQNFDESYFIESTSDNNIDSICYSINEKADNIFSRIGKKLKELWNKICKFFKRLFGKSKNTTDFNAKIKKAFDRIPNDILITGLGIAVVAAGNHNNHNNKNKDDSTADQENTDKTQTTEELPKDDKVETPKLNNGKLKEILDNAWKAEYQNHGFVIASDQPYAKNINNKLLHKNKNKKYLDMIAAVFSDNTIDVRLTGDKKIMSIDDIIFIFDHISYIKNEIDSKEINEIKASISKFVSNAHSKGIVINVDKDSLDKNLAKLTEISNKMNQLLNESSEDIFTEAKYNDRQIKKFETQIANGEDNEVLQKYIKWKNSKNANIDHQKNVVNGVSGMKEIYTDMIAICSNMMILYNDIESFREVAGKQIAEYLNSVGVNITNEY